MNALNELVKAQQQVLKKNSFKALFVFFLALAFYAFVLLSSIPGQSFSSWLYSMTDYTKAFVAAGSVLAALILTTQVYVVKNYGLGKLKKRSEVGLIGSLVSGIIATACCSPFFVGLLGLTSVAFFVAVNQTYFYALSLVIMVLSLYYSSKIIFCEECQIKVGARKEI